MENNKNSHSLDRRTFLSSAAMIGASTILPSTDVQQSTVKNSPLKSKISIALIGTGLRGQSHLDLLLRRADCEVVAFCDVDPKMIDDTKKIFSRFNLKSPPVFSEHERSYRDMIDKVKPDAVIISTPWEWHTEMAVYAMDKGVYVGLEVAGAFSVDECWQLVNTHEKSGSHLYFLENVCFRRDVMAILNMVRKDMFGEIIHLEGGYQHDLRGVKFNDGITPYDSGVEFGINGFSEARWRTHHSVHRNGDLYPTHGIGPIAQWIDLERGNRMVSICSFASKARGLQEYIVNHPKGGKSHPNASQQYKLGDKVSSMINTSNGETIILHHDTNLPRPYSLGFRVQGTKGLWMDVNKSLHIEGISPAHRWEDTKDYLDKYDHPLWKTHQEKAVGAGHGGMDYFLINSFVEHAKRNDHPVFDVYDAANWKAITALSEQSIALGNSTLAFPDFSRGRWYKRKNNFAQDDRY